ncbi:META domain-containing protein [Cellulomonas sp. S1-8]|uniref:META domain-containing protein n=1 Tax=Cellulomonas sp. S1-8 TaxID=2904790 RepID=UPI00224319CE|nr:META domain-containing protein [Cellulomonas sp. S1-8]UZN01967.1 META domain-containing protein [Cellulomonas sp. S1-8]
MRDDGHDEPTTADPTGAVPDAPWLHGTWRVVRVDGTDLADGLQGPPWLTFDGDGMVFGYAGVNRVRGTWRLEGSTLSFGPVVATLMAGPPEATTTERAVLGLLQDGGVVASQDGTLTLRTPGGRAAELVRAPASGDAAPVDAGPHALH